VGSVASQVIPPSATDLARLLADLGLLDPRAVVDGDLELHEIPRRNHGVLVLRRDGPSYFLKRGIDNDGVATVARERARYRNLHAAPGELRRFLLTLHDDPVIDGLVLDGLPDAIDLHEHHRRMRRFPPELGGQVGRALGVLHRQWRGSPEPEAAPPPWVFAIHRPSLDDAGELSPAAISLVQAIQREQALTATLDRLRSEWHSESLIHGDVRWANVLVVDPDDAAPGIRLIDWELAAHGDPAWDVGCALASYLSFWVFSIATTGPVDPWELATHAECPLEDMHASVAAFWREYCGAADDGWQPHPDRLVRGIRNCAARLLQTAFESCAEADALDRRALLHVQLAANIVARPEASAADLFGLAQHAPMGG
jgi:hypothetical protein